MTRTPEFLSAMDQLGEATDQAGAMLAMLMRYLVEAADGGERLSDEVLLNYVWALKSQNERTEQAIKALSADAIAS